MSELIKCCACDQVVAVSECEEIKDSDIVTCMNKDHKVITEFCWNCSLKPTNSKDCLEFIEEEKEQHPKFRQFTKEEMFD